MYLKQYGSLCQEIAYPILHQARKEKFIFITTKIPGNVNQEEV
jgi:hypothetical protein